MKTIILLIALLVGIVAYVRPSDAHGWKVLSMAPPTGPSETYKKLPPGGSGNVVASQPLVGKRTSESPYANLVTDFKLYRGPGNPAALDKYSSGPVRRYKRNSHTVNYHGAGRSDEKEYRQRQVAREALREAEEHKRLIEAKAAIQAANAKYINVAQARNS